MRKLLFAVCMTSISVPALASCEDLKAQIDAKLQAKGVASYTLEIVPVAQAAAAPAPSAASGTAAASAAAAAPAKEAKGKVVGSCEGDTKQIIYTRH
jgi:Protein of unknown function (DUF1161)